MNLPYDVARCLGRSDMTPQTNTCAERSGCQRYMAAVSGDFGTRTPWYMWMCNTPKHEHKLPVEVKA